MRSQGLLRILNLDRCIEQLPEVLTHEEPARFAAHENRHWGNLSRRDACRRETRWFKIDDPLPVSIER
jgi:hypothetical protein